MSEREGQHQLNVWIPNNVFDRLEALREYYGVDRLAVLKLLITADYERMVEKKVKQEFLTDALMVADKTLKEGYSMDHKKKDR